MGVYKLNPQPLTLYMYTYHFKIHIIKRLKTFFCLRTILIKLTTNKYGITLKHLTYVDTM